MSENDEYAYHYEKKNRFTDGLTKVTRGHNFRAVNTSPVVVGDIFYSSWGYDQTNICFYEVIALNGKTMATFQRIGAKRIDDDSSLTQDALVPIPGSFRPDGYKSEPRKRKYKIDPYWGASANLDSVEHLARWNGEVKYETNSSFGH